MDYIDNLGNLLKYYNKIRPIRFKSNWRKKKIDDISSLFGVLITEINDNNL